jgi:hypothetical protein
MAKVTHREDEFLVALDGEWVLVELMELRRGGWRSLKLYRKRRRSADVKKRTWRMGWNGERFAHNRDTGLLAEHHSERFKWIETHLRSKGA